MRSILPHRTLLGIAILLGLKLPAAGSLASYDALIAAHHADGGGELPYEAAFFAPLTFDTSNAVPFNFGNITGDATFEFILRGDPNNGGSSAYLAVGSDGNDSLRFEQWNDTGQLGFTRLSVADYLFTAGTHLPLLWSPAQTSHVVFRWNDATQTMELFVDGVLGGTAAGVDFAMPRGIGFLGNNAARAEGMEGTIERVTIYNSALSFGTIERHANAWLADSDPDLRLRLFNTSGQTDHTPIFFTLRVENFGATQPLSLSYMTTGEHQRHFTLSAPAEIAPLSSGFIRIGFDPLDASGDLALGLQISTNDPNQPSIGVPIRVAVDLDQGLLSAYDSLIESDHRDGSGPFPYSATLTQTTRLGTGEPDLPFDFGPISGPATFEFIVEGESGGDGLVSYLALGENSNDSLRFEQWNDTGRLGFTRTGFEDYQFTPSGNPSLLESPGVAKHITFVRHTDGQMDLYTNGTLAGTRAAANFSMPRGSGFIGSDGAGGSRLVGRIHRLTTYNYDLRPEIILRHARGYTEGAGSLAFEITQVERDTQGHPAITWTSYEGAVYSVERSSTLETWSSVADGIVGAEGSSTTLTDPDPPDAAPLFYRVRVHFRHVVP